MNSTAIALTAAAVLLTAAVVYVVTRPPAMPIAGGFATTPEQLAVAAALGQTRDTLARFLPDLPGGTPRASTGGGLQGVLNDAQAGLVKGKQVYGSLENLFNQTKSLF
ncbi:hypothetical protein [Hyalangium sp.]|uniref:hypothetical protein n=1 Tax=Hyalangium sp. TaxID=2028555 RepID=UPI002D28D87E|nr:hypothetical protein [Hyalangium sp.]HYI00570.1 hypothetical protein [Hyalangium sp.]